MQGQEPASRESRSSNEAAPRARRSRRTHQRAPAPELQQQSAAEVRQSDARYTAPTTARRESALGVAGDVPWGSHFCQFYRTPQDLLDVLVPYFRAGLENNEFCMWITSEPLQAREARAALAAAVPDLDQRLAAGQMEILDYRQWYVLEGKFDAARVLAGWMAKLQEALQRGYEGLRLTGNTFWLEDRLWKDFADYEAAVDAVIGRYRMLALCTYSLDKCGAFQVIDAARNHQFALIRQDRKWEILQSLQRKQAEITLREAHERLQLQTEELQTANEELHAQAEELQASNEELREQELALRESEERFRATYEQAAIGIEMLSLDGRLLRGNGTLRRILGYEERELRNRCFSDITHPEDLPREMVLLNDLLAGRIPSYTIEKRYLHKDGHSVWVRVTSSLARVAEPYRISIIEDITERKGAEEQLVRLNRTLRALSNSSQALTHAAEESAYLQEVCRIVVQDCGHAMVWIGYAEQDEAKSVRPAAYAGFEEGYLETLHLTWADTERGRGPTGTAIRTGRPTLCRNMLTDPNFAPWREQALQRGYASSIVLPLLAEGKTFGAITIYSREPDPFPPDEVALLMELATDLVHGITTLRLRAAHARAEEAVRENEQRLRLALEGGKMGRWEWEVRNDAVFWDERVSELLGLNPAGPASTRLFFSVIDSRDRNAVRQLVDQSLAGGEDYRAEFRIHHPNGETPWLVSKGKVFRDEQGQAVRMMGVLYDITHRKQMEADLRRLNDQLEEEVQAQTEELKDTVDRLQDEVARRVLAEGKLRKRSQMLEAFFQHTITPLAFLDKYFNFVRVNAAYAQADARDPQYFVGKNHFALYPHDGNRAIFEQVVRTKQPYFAYAKPFTYPDDPQRVTYWDWQLTPLLDERGEVQFLVLNLEDVTAQQTAFHELEQRARQLQKLTLELSQAEDRERKRLAQILHDDLQQQLAAAKFHLSLVGRRAPKDAAFRQAVTQLDQILKDAIEKSRSLSHELSPAVLYHSDLGETFEWLARQLKTKHGLTVHVESRGRIDPASEPLKVFLFRTAQEILFNVVKHAHVREARLRLQRINGSIWLTISDQGQGFDPRVLSETEGFGLLSIRERIELLGGRMRIRSAPGRGSTFLLAVPDDRRPADGKQTTEDGPPRIAPPAVLRPPSSVLRVLLVDDHKVMREGLATLLNEQADLEVVGQAGNGREAVDLADRLRPDVIVMDAAMPVMAGAEATRQIKLRRPGVRIVALSMFEETDMSEAMHRAGAERYLLKTAPSHELLAAIRGRSAAVD